MASSERWKFWLPIALSILFGCGAPLIALLVTVSNQGVAFEEFRESNTRALEDLKERISDVKSATAGYVSREVLELQLANIRLEQKLLEEKLANHIRETAKK